MCIIEGMGAIEETHRSGPIQGTRITFRYAWTQIVIDPTGSPTVCLTDEVAAVALRGIGQWMTRNAIFREMAIRIHYEQYFCGRALVSLLRP